MSAIHEDFFEKNNFQSDSIISSFTSIGESSGLAHASHLFKTEKPLIVNNSTNLDSKVPDNSNCFLLKENTLEHSPFISNRTLHTVPISSNVILDTKNLYQSNSNLDSKFIPAPPSTKKRSSNSRRIHHIPFTNDSESEFESDLVAEIHSKNFSNTSSRPNSRVSEPNLDYRNSNYFLSDLPNPPQIRTIVPLPKHPFRLNKDDSNQMQTNSIQNKYLDSLKLSERRLPSLPTFDSRSLPTPPYFIHNPDISESKVLNSNLASCQDFYLIPVSHHLDTSHCENEISSEYSSHNIINQEEFYQIQYYPFITYMPSILPYSGLPNLDNDIDYSSDPNSCYSNSCIYPQYLADNYGNTSQNIFYSTSSVHTVGYPNHFNYSNIITKVEKQNFDNVSSISNYSNLNLTNDNLNDINYICHDDTSTHNEDKRSTPLNFTFHHPKGLFSPTGHFIIIRPICDVVSIKRLFDVYKFAHFSNNQFDFPGPLSFNSVKSHIIKFSNEKSLLSHNEGFLDASLMWKYLSRLTIKDGAILDSDIVDILLYYRTEIPINELKNSYTSSKIDIDLEEIRYKVFHNKINEAIELCIKIGQWNYAILLAETLGEQSRLSVLHKFVYAMSPYDPLQSYFSSFFGMKPQGIDAVFIQKGICWASHLAMLLSHKQLSSAQSSIATLTEYICENSNPMRYHFVNLMNKEPLGHWDDSESNFKILGINSDKINPKFFSPSILYMTEIYEYANHLSNLDFSLPGFQMYKFLLAYQYAESGYFKLALNYCESISHFTQRSPYNYSVSFLNELLKLSDLLYGLLVEHAGSNLQLSNMVPKWILQLISNIEQQNGGSVYVPTPSIPMVTPAPLYNNSYVLYYLNQKSKVSPLIENSDNETSHITPTTNNFIIDHQNICNKFSYTNNLRNYHEDSFYPISEKSINNTSNSITPNQNIMISTSDSSSQLGNVQSLIIASEDDTTTESFKSAGDESIRKNNTDFDTDSSDIDEIMVQFPDLNKESSQTFLSPMTNDKSNTKLQKQTEINDKKSLLSTISNYIKVLRPQSNRKFIQMNLPDDEMRTIYYDEFNKCWINTEADEKDLDYHSAPPLDFQVTNDTQINKTLSQDNIICNSMLKNRLHSKYVDVLNPTKSNNAKTNSFLHPFTFPLEKPLERNIYIPSFKINENENNLANRSVSPEIMSFPTASISAASKEVQQILARNDKVLQDTPGIRNCNFTNDNHSNHIN